MEHADYLAELTADTRTLGAVMAVADLTMPVRSCPGWSLADLGYHLAEVYQHKIAAMLGSARPDPWPPEPLPELWRRAVPEFLATSAVDLLEELSQRDPAQPCWTWLPEDQTVGFWARRMTQETVIHLWDALDAVKRPEPIGEGIAADGIDELLGAFLAGDWSDEPQPGPYGTVEIRAERDQLACRTGTRRGHCSATVTHRTIRRTCTTRRTSATRRSCRSGRSCTAGRARHTEGSCRGESSSRTERVCRTACSRRRSAHRRSARNVVGAVGTPALAGAGERRAGTR